MARIKDIAEKAGVSPTTVSNVIHGNTKRVSAEKVERIKQILEESRYVPSMAARSLVKENSNIIGIIIAYSKRDQRNVTEDPFIGQILGNLEELLREQGYYVMLYAAEEPLEIFTLASTWKTDGLIIIGFSETDCVILRKQTSTPFVTVDSYIENKRQECSANVGSQDFDGGYLMGKYLADCGHRKLAFLCDNDAGVDHSRWLGFQKALEEMNISCGEQDHIFIERDKRERRMRYRKLYDWFMKKTAIFCASDFYGAELVNFFHDQGIQVPDQISVTGFDDNIFAETVRPRLTTIRQDIYQKASSVVDSLLGLIKDGVVEEPDIRLSVRLMERESVKKI